ncbi:hypothetical protein RFI_00490 [Reticulomyxa filosa]|uniref:Uncharacterized protein n=1 Tax=Reticulomyxa filosa TaxID=46433 RepID=X6PEV3_RETFI|nr:hypothetical protein RFI_00490 [Reticulomyxa filosa]|eukprot:ETO36574.1 hypothetical protein RFI_00490 [Reticulomyxa filosa]
MFPLQSFSTIGLKKYKLELSTDIQNTLDFKKHWNDNWKRANAEAAKIIQQKLNKNKEGLIVVAKNVSEWPNKPNQNLNKNGDLLFSFISSVSSGKTKTKQFGEYWLYVLKKKLVILEDMVIDGNVYAVNCEIQCQGKVNITTQLFVSDNAIIDSNLKQEILPIEWNTRLHHDIPVYLQDLQDNAEECLENEVFDDAILNLQKCLQISVETFGCNHAYIADSYHKIGNANLEKKLYDNAIEFYKKSLELRLELFGIYHPLVADSYNNLGLSFHDKGQYDKAVEYYEKSISIGVAVYGNYHKDIADSYYNLGVTYDSKEQYDAAIECYEKALNISKEIFQKVNIDVGDVKWNLGAAFERKGETEIACNYYGEAWKIFSTVVGDWHEDTVEIKKIMQRSAGKTI